MRPVPEVDRVLATVLFTDIVGSTERLAALGDRAWRALLDAHHEIVRRELERHRGREIKFAGDGLLATSPSCDSRWGVMTLGFQLEFHNAMVASGRSSFCVRTRTPPKSQGENDGRRGQNPIPIDRSGERCVATDRPGTRAAGGIRSGPAGE